MDVRVGLLFLFVFSWAADARELVITSSSNGETVLSDILGLQINHQKSEREIKALKGVGKNKEVCKLCEEFAVEALKYFSENKTQAEVMDVLHKACSRMRAFKQQCVTLVDYYAPLFFVEIETVQPKEFCLKVDLCDQVVITSQALSKDSCELCHRAVAEVLLKLKDPDTELDIIELLLKVCDAVGSHMKKCKRMVFEYGPLILSNAEQYLQKSDICTTIHACDPQFAGNKQEISMVNTPMFSDA